MSFGQKQQIQQLGTTVENLLYITCNSGKTTVVRSVVPKTIDIYSKYRQIQQIQHLKPLVEKNRGIRQNREKYFRLIAHIRVYIGILPTVVLAWKEHGMTEAELERWLGKKIKGMDGLYLKWVSPGTVGVPDRIIILPGGRVWFVELKQQGKRPTLCQAQVHRKLLARGAQVRVIAGFQQAAAFVDTLTKEVMPA